MGFQGKTDRNKPWELAALVVAQDRCCKKPRGPALRLLRFYSAVIASVVSGSPLFHPTLAELRFRIPSFRVPVANAPGRKKGRKAEGPFAPLGKPLESINNLWGGSLQRDLLSKPSEGLEMKRFPYAGRKSNDIFGIRLRFDFDSTWRRIILFPFICRVAEFFIEVPLASGDTCPSKWTLFSVILIKRIQFMSLLITHNQ